MVASECGTASGDAGVHASQGGGNGASRWSGRRGSNSRPLPWQGPGSILYSGEAENGLDAPTYPEYACVSTLIPRGASLHWRSCAPQRCPGPQSHVEAWRPWLGSTPEHGPKHPVPAVATEYP